MEKINKDFINYSKLVYPTILTDNERDMLNYYTSFFYSRINESLRNGDKKTYYREAGILDNAIKKFKYVGGLTVYRDLFIYDDKLSKFISTLDKGYIIDKGYQSTSLEKGKFMGGYTVRMEIDVPDVNVGAYIKYVSLMSHEEEFLIKRNTKLNILNVDDTVIDGDQKIYYVKARVGR